MQNNQNKALYVLSLEQSSFLVQPTLLAVLSPLGQRSAAKKARVWKHRRLLRKKGTRYAPVAWSGSRCLDELAISAMQL